LRTGDRKADAAEVPLPRDIRELRAEDLLAQPPALCGDRQISEGEVRQVSCSGELSHTIVE